MEVYIPLIAIVAILVSVVIYHFKKLENDNNKEKVDKLREDLVKLEEEKNAQSLIIADRQQALEELNLEFRTVKNNTCFMKDSLAQVESAVKEKNKELLEISKEIQKTLDSQEQQYLTKAKECSKRFDEKMAQYEQTLSTYKSTVSSAAASFSTSLEDAYLKAESLYKNKIAGVEQEYNEALENLEKVKNTLSAANEAQLRERQKKEKEDFFKLKISETDLEDIAKLEQVKRTLNNPLILSKLIWTSYFQKETNELCNRVVGLGKECGIYKITNISTDQCYIGQSVDITQRFKDHIKCGLGIEASATNKLYKAMQSYGVWNFTFEVIEKCDRSLLNEKERLWIELYQSDKVGYNTNRGVKQ